MEIFLVIAIIAIAFLAIMCFVQYRIIRQRDKIILYLGTKNEENNRKFAERINIVNGSLQCQKVMIANAVMKHMMEHKPSIMVLACDWKSYIQDVSLLILTDEYGNEEL